MRSAKFLAWFLPLALLGTLGRTSVTGVATCRSGTTQQGSGDWRVEHQRHWNNRLIGIRQRVVYRRIRHHKITLFLFHPTRQAVRARPLVVYVHGGALRFGTAMITNANTPHNRLMVSVERRLIRDNIDFVSVNYRLAPMHPWPDPLNDVKHAVRYLDHHAGQLGIDPDRMAIMGDSAGGELSSFVGLTMARKNSEQPVVRGVVDLFGPADRQPFAREWRARYGLAPNPVYGVYTPERVRLESAVSHVHVGAPPFLIIQGDRDRVVPPGQSLMLKERLEDFNVPVREIVVQNAGHELVARGGAIHPGIGALAGDITRFLEHSLAVKSGG